MGYPAAIILPCPVGQCLQSAPIPGSFSIAPWADVTPVAATKTLRPFESDTYAILFDSSA